jgi:hypothetical protein
MGVKVKTDLLHRGWLAAIGSLPAAAAIAG